MSIYRRAARIDANQPGIISALRQAGASVEVIRQPVDLVVGYQGFTVLVEVKDGSKAPSARRYTEQQSEIMFTWRGGHIYTITSVEDARKMLADIAAAQAAYHPPMRHKYGL